ncbi:ilvbl protein [Capsaspora owczarzaki ATCC 30864]|uniref:Ilvbl protein n=1 Tax=Capsaspora owczarzaki (strain ATCC 30864) TaxID=595528 RepID=A0A0D2VFV8_CAPO3|nr:ilvbl protein [Capsaspora owczarzaki ATCC 30864]KJE88622.1 ilvbl protein [Capsaspora owczarzaki ATCC 30864]|eukprot:XP_004365119.1 ilvbl protein [Capsaspora owczarzaki ATCC 30864]
MSASQKFAISPSAPGFVQLLLEHPGKTAAGIALAAGVAFAVSRVVSFLRIGGKVDRESPRHGGELVAETLKAHGVKFVFTLVGGHISPILVGCENLGIKVVDTRHEVTTVFAADAVARLSGVPGVAVVTAGPGLTNTVTAVKNAQMAESPLLLMGGAAATLLKGRGALQDIDQMALFKPICKYCATITRVQDIVPTLREALRIAQSGVPGPVFVEFPIDSLYPYSVVAREFLKGDKKKNLTARIVGWYLQHYVNKLFGGAWRNYDYSPLPVDIPRASARQLAQAATILRSAVKPAILLGSQSTLPPTKAEDLQAALLSLGIPCFLGGMSRGLLGKESAIQAKQRRKEALQEADVIILAGAICDFRLDYGRSFNRRAKIIAVNRNSDALTKNTDMFWKPTMAVKGDPGSFIVSLAAIVAGSYTCDPTWVELLRSRDVAKDADNKKKAAEPSADGKLNPLSVLSKFDEVLSDDSILVADGGDFVGTAAYIVRPRGPLRWLDPGAFGTLGVGGGFALGAKLVRPDADVWVIYGDGSLGYSVAEYDTFTRFGLPIISIVGNDAGWTQIAREQVPMFNTSVACALAYTDYHTVADGFGGKGFVVHTLEELGAAYAQAVRITREQKKPVLINVVIGKTNFREGSISV